MYCDIHNVPKKLNKQKRNICPVCRKEKEKAKRHKHKAILVEKMGDRCSSCLKQFNLICYQFHHLDPSIKDYQISDQIRTLDKALEEAEKCVLLCANCHHEEEYSLNENSRLRGDTPLQLQGEDYFCEHHGKVQIRTYKGKDNVCKKCAHQDYLRDRYYHNKILAAEFLGNECYNCKYDKSVAGLAFHHIDPNNKEYELGGNIMYSTADKLLQEVQKCVLLCHNCHVVHHNSEAIDFSKISYPTSLLDKQSKMLEDAKQLKIDKARKPSFKEESKKFNREKIIVGVVNKGKDVFLKEYPISGRKFKALLKFWNLNKNSNFAPDLVTVVDNSSISAVSLKRLVEQKGFEEAKRELGLDENISVEIIENFLGMFELKAKLALSTQREERSEGFFWPPNKAELEKLVWEYSVVDLGKRFGVSDNAVRKWCKKFDVKTPSKGYWAKQYASEGKCLPPRKEYSPPISKEELEQKYINEQMLLKDMAVLYGVYWKTVSRWLKFYGLKE